MSYSYIPGTCNLGKEEIRRRQFVALIGLILSISSLIGLISADAEPMARVSYGLMGTFNLGKLGDIAKVQSPEDRRADRKTALTIFGQAVLLAGGLTILLVLIPF